MNVHNILTSFRRYIIINITLINPRLPAVVPIESDLIDDSAKASNIFLKLIRFSLVSQLKAIVKTVDQKAEYAGDFTDIINSINNII